MLKQLWNDECGVIISAELVLVATILVIGMITGLASLRDAVVTEMADVGQAVSQLNQSFSIGGVVGPNTFTSGSAFIDTLDFGDVPNGGIQTSFPRCIVFGVPPTPEQ